MNITLDRRVSEEKSLEDVTEDDSSRSFQRKLRSLRRTVSGVRHQRSSKGSLRMQSQGSLPKSLRSEVSEGRLEEGSTEKSLKELQSSLSRSLRRKVSGGTSKEKSPEGVTGLRWKSPKRSLWRTSPTRFRGSPRRNLRRRFSERSSRR